MKNQSILVHLACGLIAWSSGCSTNDTVTQDDNSWSVEEPPPVEGEQEPHTHPPILTDGSEPQDVNFVFHPLARAKAPIRWNEDPEHGRAMLYTGRVIKLDTITFNDARSRWENKRDVPSDAKIWLGVRFPPELSDDDTHHVFECPKISSNTLKSRTHLENKVVFCEGYRGLTIHILDKDAEQIAWFDETTQRHIDAAIRGEFAEYFQDYVQAGKLPWWETSVFIQHENGNLEFLKLTRNNKVYSAFKDQYHEEPQLYVDASSVIE